MLHVLKRVCYVKLPLLLLFFIYGKPAIAQVDLGYNGFKNFIEKGKYGLKNKAGKVIVPAIYDRIGYKGYAQESFRLAIEQNRIPVNIGATIKNPYKGHWGFVDTAGNVVIPIEYDDIFSITDGRIKVQKQKNYGFIDTNGKVVVPINNERIISYNESLAFIQRKSGDPYTCIDVSGNEVFKLPMYWHPDDSGFNLGLCATRIYDPKTKTSKLGYINTKGKIAIEPTFDEKIWGNGAFNHNLYVAKVLKVDENKNYRYGLIDTLGKVIIPLYYSERELEIKHNKIYLTQNGKQHIYNSIAEITGNKQDSNGGTSVGVTDALILGKTAFNKGDFSRAAIYLRNPQVREQAEAYYYMGVMYAEGKGLEKNIILARKWLQKAIEKGYAPATEILNKLAITSDE